MATKASVIQDSVEQVANALDDAGVVYPAAVTKYGMTVLSFLTGASIAYLATRRFLEKKYAAIAEEEIAYIAEAEIEKIRDLYFEKARQTFDGATPPKPSLGQLMADLQYTGIKSNELTDVEPTDVEEDDEDEVPEVQNVFARTDAGWNWPTENAYREALEPGVPYVIHRDEFFANENEWTQGHYTYFKGDDVLIDEHDAPVDDQAALVGIMNLTMFGHGSFDPNIVYVRNPELEIEIAIMRSDDSFSDQQKGVSAKEPEATEDLKDPEPGDPRKRRSRGND